MPPPLDFLTPLGKRLYEQAWRNGWRPATQAQRTRAAEQARERLSGVPFYAKQAAAMEAQTGDPLAYWLTLQALPSDPPNP